MCVTVGFLLSFAGQTRMTLMLVFIVDHYLNVFLPYKCPKHQVKIVTSLSVAFWLFSVVIQAFMLPGILDCYSFLHPRWTCSPSPECSNACSYYGAVYFVIVLVPVAVVSIIFHAQVYHKAKKVRKEMAEQTGTAADDDEAHKKERRAAVTFFLLFITAFTFVIPSLGLNIITAIVSSFTDSSELHPALYALLVVAYDLITLQSIMDPIVIMRNQDFKEVVSKVKRIASQKWHCGE